MRKVPINIDYSERNNIANGNYIYMYIAVVLFCIKLLAYYTILDLAALLSNTFMYFRKRFCLLIRRYVHNLRGNKSQLHRKCYIRFILVPMYSNNI